MRTLIVKFLKNMFVNAIEKASRTMFPIFRLEKIGPTEGRIAVVGTGFFIGPDGKFATAAHVFDTANEKTEFQFRGWMPDKVFNPRLVIKEFKKDASNDLFIGQVDLETPDYLELSDELAPIGRSVCVSGYPLNSIKTTAAGLDVGGIRRYFQPTFVLDHAVIESPGKNGNKKHDGFLIRDIGLSGMSGGPIFDTEGLVLGIQAATISRENVIGVRKVDVHNGQAIKSSLFKSLLNS
ncbi:MAG: hypothetical protein A3D49_00050 [Candidatus Zambryskibacteria bacterium RIFCSPHIGHO2_02_FULL_43_37]|uniref:Serine protease n=1 Tax=Candidatus Zambryskibacteria bacterium RIFCSPHIGHO2_02_FULL_43_37 TaxID=1802749 RepID=A0A1G2TIE4_9BACT|nr:MAG: hypothetical protein A3D49_00050 [Candidatus Zambryskibacteria bacterium RIFCSPHIGHO2_02_FULL_43_37]